MEYDLLNRLTRVIDPLGHQVEFTYDSRNHLLTMTDPNGNVTRRSYDANGNLLTQTNALNQTTHYEYDGEDRLTKVIDAKGNITQLAYDAKGRVIKITDPLGHSRQIKYDEVDNILQQFDALGKVVASFSYDATHTITSQRDALNQQTRFEYDNLGRLTQTTDPLNRVTQFAYDALNRLTHSLDALQGISQQAFDNDGNRNSLLDPNDNETQFSFDKDGRLVQERVATGNSTSYHYNSRDLLEQVINGRGQQREFEYDAANRLVSIADVDGTISFTYDNNGNVLTVKDNQGTITRTYDALNRITSYTDVNGNKIQYEYDSIGNLATLIYPDGKQVHYDYNAVNQLIKVTDWKGRITQYQYDANGQLIKTLRPNGTQQLRHYDVKGQLLQQRDILNQTVITQFDYRYDAVGNIIEETKQPAHVVPNLQLEMTYAPANQLATVNQQTVELDADGNMINGILKGQLTQFNFDSRNRLTQVGDTIYRYDAENQRIAVNDTQYVINSQPNLSQVLVRTKGNGEVTYYVYGLGLIGEESAGNYFSYHFDYRGSTVALTNAVGQVVDRIAYSAYGELLTQPTHDTPFLFNGMYGVISDDNGLYYMRARFYSPEIKRFVNQDVLLGNIVDGQTLNRFAFVTGNPVSFVDPFGLKEVEVIFGGAHWYGHVALKIGNTVYTNGRYEFPEQELYSFGLVGSNVLIVQSAASYENRIRNLGGYGLILNLTDEQSSFIESYYKDMIKESKRLSNGGYLLPDDYIFVANNCATFTRDALMEGLPWYYTFFMGSVLYPGDLDLALQIPTLIKETQYYGK